MQEQQQECSFLKWFKQQKKNSPQQNAFEAIWPHSHQTSRVESIQNESLYVLTGNQI